MRMLLTLTIPVARGNAAIKDGSIQKVIEDTVKKLKPEVTYFYPANGLRKALMVFDLAKESDIVGSLEPLWLGLDAEIELVPVMSLDDLQAGFKSLSQ